MQMQLQDLLTKVPDRNSLDDKAGNSIYTNVSTSDKSLSSNDSAQGIANEGLGENDYYHLNLETNTAIFNFYAEDEDDEYASKTRTSTVKSTSSATNTSSLEEETAKIAEGVKFAINKSFQQKHREQEVNREIEGITITPGSDSYEAGFTIDIDKLVNSFGIINPDGKDEDIKSVEELCSYIAHKILISTTNKYKDLFSVDGKKIKIEFQVPRAFQDYVTRDFQNYFLMVQGTEQSVDNGRTIIDIIQKNMIDIISSAHQQQFTPVDSTDVLKSARRAICDDAKKIVESKFDITQEIIESQEEENTISDITQQLLDRAKKSINRASITDIELTNPEVIHEDKNTVVTSNTNSAELFNISLLTENVGANFDQKQHADVLEGGNTKGKSAVEYNQNTQLCTTEKFNYANQNAMHANGRNLSMMKTSSVKNYNFGQYNNIDVIKYSRSENKYLNMQENIVEASEILVEVLENNEIESVQKLSFIIKYLGLFYAEKIASICRINGFEELYDDNYKFKIENYISNTNLPVMEKIMSFVKSNKIDESILNNIAFTYAKQIIIKNHNNNYCGFIYIAASDEDTLKNKLEKFYFKDQLQDHIKLLAEKSQGDGNIKRLKSDAYITPYCINDAQRSMQEQFINDLLKYNQNAETTITVNGLNVEDQIKAGFSLGDLLSAEYHSSLKKEGELKDDMTTRQKKVEQLYNLRLETDKHIESKIQQDGKNFGKSQSAKEREANSKFSALTNVFGHRNKKAFKAARKESYSRTRELANSLDKTIKEAAAAA